MTSKELNENIEVFMLYVNITTADGNVGGTGIIDSSFSGEVLTVGSA